MICEKTVTGYVPQFATNLSPTGNIGVNEPLVFSWTGIPGVTRYGIELNDSNGRVWERHDIPAYTTSVAYDGPSLTVGETYSYLVSSVIITGGEWNSSFSFESFTIVP